MLKAILFDMDGTITRPHIDWKTLRARVGAPEGMTLIAHIDGLPAEEAVVAEAFLREVEMDAAERAVANPGVEELFGRLYDLPLKLALITNNHREAMVHVVARFGLRFDLLLSREDATLKPAPDLFLLALERLRLGAGDVVCLGDGRYDRMACEAAGIRYIHLAHDPEEPEDGPTIRSLAELPGLLGLDGGWAGPA